MFQQLPAITAVHGWLPEKRITNQDLESMVDTNDEWITSRTGIKERRILEGEGKGTSVMATRAVEGLIEKLGIDSTAIDVIICATATPDMAYISTANLVCRNVGAGTAMSFDISAACSGFIYALEIGANFIRSGNYKKVVVIGADKNTSVINYRDRASCILFGDGAAAVMLEPSKNDYGIHDAMLHTDGNGSDMLRVKRGGSAYPLTPNTLDNGEHYFFQDGKSVFRHAVTRMTEVVDKMMEKHHLTAENLAFLVPHQANLRILEAIARRLNLPLSQVTINIQKYGNTTAATVPLCLWEWEQIFKKGDKIVLAAFGGGFTWGAVYLSWAY
jgi:3-oxoacyl-[acyl-carrier-protein] synthase III